MKTVFRNAKVVLPHRVISGGIQVEGSQIVKIFLEGEEIYGEVEIDCKGLFLAPGFVDLHVHGGGGYDFMDGTEEAANAILTTHAKYGTTSMLPTTLSSSQEKVVGALRVIETIQEKWKGGPRILGAHLEGNFFSLAQAGAQDPKYIICPLEENYIPIISSVSNIKRISCAPEVSNACDFARKMSSKGILMSVAHTEASYDEMVKGAENGFSHMTHLYNGCSFMQSPNYYCHVGAAEAVLLMDDMTAEVIADGKHVPKELLQLVYRIKGAEKINLCTDAMCAADMPDGEYKLGMLDVVVADEVAVLKEQNTFAGSVCTSNRAVRTMYKTVGVPIHEAVKMMTVTPAKLVHEFERLGSIAIGKYADINLFDEDIQVYYTMIHGVEYQNKLQIGEKQ